MLECVPCTPAHIEQLKVTLREADRHELRLSTGKEPEEALEESVRVSDKTLAWVEDGAVLCVFGVAPHPLLPDVGTPWLLASDAATKKGMRFCRKCGESLQAISQKYSRLLNMVHAGNAVALRWLKWCGFTLHQTIPVGPTNAPFVLFSKEVTKHV